MGQISPHPSQLPHAPLIVFVLKWILMKCGLFAAGYLVLFRSQSVREPSFCLFLHQNDQNVQFSSLHNQKPKQAKGELRWAPLCGCVYAIFVYSPFFSRAMWMHFNWYLVECNLFMHSGLGQQQQLHQQQQQFKSRLQTVIVGVRIPWIRFLLQLISITWLIYIHFSVFSPHVLRSAKGGWHPAEIDHWVPERYQGLNEADAVSLPAEEDDRPPTEKISQSVAA